MSSSISNASSPSNAYVPLSKRELITIVPPKNPEEELLLVKQLYNAASVPTLEEKTKAPYKKTVSKYGEVYLDPNLRVQGPSYVISEYGKVSVRPASYELPGLSDIKEQNSPPEVIESVVSLMQQAHPEQENNTGITFKQEKNGEVEINTQKNGYNIVYYILPDGSVKGEMISLTTSDRLGVYEILKPGELPPLQEGQVRPMGKSLNIEG